MSFPSINNPLQRLQGLPNATNWLGTWIIGGQYYMNDMVVDPNGSTYILTGATASASGLDPSHNTVWTEFSGVSTGVKSLHAGDGISIDETDPANPKVNNEGVITLIEGTNVSIIEDPPHTFTINATGLTEVIAGVGIEVIPDLDNPLSISVFNTGILSVSVDNEGLSKTSSAAGQLVTLNNTGVLTLIPGDGIASTGGQLPQVSNTGVLFVGGQGAIEVSGLVQIPTISCSTGKVSLIFTVITTNIQTNPYPIPGVDLDTSPPTFYFGYILIDLNLNFFSFSLKQSVPMKGGFLLDFSNWVIEIGLSVGVLGDGFSSIFDIEFDDDETTGHPTYNLSKLVTLCPSFDTITTPYTFNLGKIYFDFTDAWNSGIRTITAITLTNRTVKGERFGETIPSDMYIKGGGGLWGTYYPNGIQ